MTLEALEVGEFTKQEGVEREESLEPSSEEPTRRLRRGRWRKYERTTVWGHGGYRKRFQEGKAAVVLMLLQSAPGEDWDVSLGSVTRASLAVPVPGKQRLHVWAAPALELGAQVRGAPSRSGTISHGRKKDCRRERNQGHWKGEDGIGRSRSPATPSCTDIARPWPRVAPVHLSPCVLRRGGVCALQPLLHSL